MGKVNRYHSLGAYVQKFRWLWMLAAILLGGVAFFTQYYAHETMFAEARQNLNQLMHERSQKISNFLQLNHDAISSLTSHPDTVKLMTTSDMAHNTKVELEYTLLISQYQKKYHFLKMFLISSKGDVIYSHTFDPTQKSGDDKKQANLISTTNHNNLKESVLRSQATLSQDWSEFSYDPVKQTPSLFLTTPVFDQGKNIGFLALQVDHNKLYTIINDFEGLGVTGEIILGKTVDKSAIIVGPTRKSKKEGFKTLTSLKSKRELPLIYASQDQKGSGPYTDYVNDHVYGVWGFLPFLNLGIVVKKNMSEIQALNGNKMLMIKISYALFVLAIMSLLIGFYGLCLSPFTPQTDTKVNHQNALKQFIEVLTGISAFVLAGTLCYQLYHTSSWLSQATTSEEQYLNVASEQFDHSLKSIATIGHVIAEDLQSGRLIYDELSHRIERDIKENETILGLSIAFKPFAYKKDMRLYAPFYYRAQDKVHNASFDAMIDYELADPALVPWYSLKLPTEGKWSSPFVETMSGKNVVVFSVPFYAPEDTKRQKALGTISVFYSLEGVRRLIESYETGFSGYYLLLSQSGQFLSYPLQDYVIQHKTIFDLAQQMEERTLIELGKKIKEQKSGFVSYFIANTQETEWIHFKSLSSANWVLGKVGTEQNLLATPLSSGIDYKILFIETLIFSLLAVALLGRLYFLTVPKVRFTLGLCSAVLVFFNTILWIWIYFQELPSNEDETIVNGPVTLSLYLDEQNKRSDLLYEDKPHTISTGLYLSTLRVNRMDNTIAFNSAFWQIRNDDPANENKGAFNFPQASTVQIDAVHKKAIPEGTSRLWNLYAILAQNLTYKAYPFDSHRLRVTISPKDLTQNVIFVPSLESYRYLDPSKKPGIATDVVPNGFYLTKSFFAYQPLAPNVNFGLSSQMASKEMSTLSYNMILKRDILDSLISYVLPLLIVLVLLFAVLHVLHSMLEKALPALAALIFTLVLLHHNLRASLGVNEVLYIEYAFFTTYFVHLLVVIYAVGLYLNPSIRDPKGMVNSLCIAVFWPLNLLFWVLSTLYVFF